MTSGIARDHPGSNKVSMMETRYCTSVSLATDPAQAGNKQKTNHSLSASKMSGMYKAVRFL